MLRTVAVVFAVFVAVGATLWVVLADGSGAKRGASSDGAAVVNDGEVGATTGAAVESQEGSSGAGATTDDEAPERAERDRYVPQPTDEFVWLEDDVAPRERLRHAVRMLCHEDRPDWVFTETLHLAQQYPEIAAEELALGLRSRHGLDPCCGILVRLGENAAPAVPELMRFLADHPTPIANTLVAIGEPAAEAIARGLRHSEVAVRAELVDRLDAWRWAWRDEGRQAPPAIAAAVTALLSDPEVHVRCSAVRIALFWAASPAAAAKIVRQGLGDAEASVREASIAELPEGVAELVVDDLVHALDDVDEEVATTAGSVIADLAEPAVGAGPALLRRIRSAAASGRIPDDVWFSALGTVDRAALRRLASHDAEGIRAEAVRHVVQDLRLPEDVDVVIVALPDPSAKVRLATLGGLARDRALAKLDDGLRRTLLVALGERLVAKRREERRRVLAVLIEQPALPASLAGPLGVAVNDEDSWVRLVAARALALLPAAVAPEADVARAKALTAALLDDHLRVRRATLETVRTAGVSDEALVRAVRRLLVSEDVHERIAAARALVALDPTAPEPATVFAEHRVHRSEVVREYVVRGVGELALASSTHREKALDHLRNRLSDKNHDVRLAAARALTPLGRHAAPAVPELVERLEWGYPQVWLAIFETLAAIGPDASAAVEVLRRHARAESQDVREGAQRALEAIEGAGTD